MSEPSFHEFLAQQRRRIQQRLTRRAERAPVRLRTREALPLLQVQTRGTCGSLGQKRKDLSELDGTYEG